MHNGVIPPGGFPTDWAERPQPYDATTALAKALAEDRLPAWLASLAPPDPAYQQLQGLLARYQAIALDGGWPEIAAGKPLELRSEDDRTLVLRRRLAIEGFGIGRRGPALRRGCRPGRRRLPDPARHRAERQGRRKTLAELNVRVEARVAQIRANMERRRWSARTTPGTRIEVNVAAQSFDYFRDGKPILSMRTIVGRPADRTPLFSDQVESILFNPPWNVPTTIAQKEIWPKERRSPGYLQRNGFVTVPGPGGVSLQQKPGPNSALGRVKFDLPNRFDVYLHDTPNHALFAQDQRAFSHGCIRLDKPIDLARLLLDGDPQWTPQAIQAALDQTTTVRAILARPVPVSIAYWTVFVDSQGRANFRRDLYGWDAKVLQLSEARR